ncbi:MAG: hypothetical protein JSV76_06250, partial [Candidatus Bathyarchaeota archaeon]
MTYQVSRTRLLPFILLVIGLIGGIGFVTLSAMPQTTNFIQRGNFWYDSWGYTRNYAVGDDGFIPNLAYEALGEWRDLAFQLGTQFISEYPDRIRRAEAILRWVQQWTEYGYDEDNVVIGGVAQPEWAWNADEMTQQIDFDTTTRAIGDCEDLTFLCSALYEGAEFDTAIVLTSEHAALLIWLPEYPQGLKWDIPNDGREYGWIWVEATGANNPLGWTPDEFRNGYWDAFVVERMYITNVQNTPETPQADDQVIITATIYNSTTIVTRVTVEYQVRGIRNEISMETTGRNEYRAYIPPQSEG